MLPPSLIIAQSPFVSLMLQIKVMLTRRPSVFLAVTVFRISYDNTQFMVLFLLSCFTVYYYYYFEIVNRPKSNQRVVCGYRLRCNFVEMVVPLNQQQNAVPRQVGHLHKILICWFPSLVMRLGVRSIIIRNSPW